MSFKVKLSGNRSSIYLFQRGILAPLVFFASFVLVSCKTDSLKLSETALIEESNGYFVPEGLTFLYGSNATLCCVSENTAYVLEGVLTQQCRVRQLPPIPIAVYDSVALKVRRYMPESGIRTIPSDEITPYHDLGVDITSPWVAPRYKQLVFQNDSSIIALVRVSVASFVGVSTRASWFPFIALLTLSYPGFELRNVVPLNVDTTRPYVQDITLGVIGVDTIVCSSFDVLRFNNPDPANLVVAELFSYNGARHQRPAIRIPQLLNGPTGYSGWLDGFVFNKSSIIVGNDLNGMIVKVDCSSQHDPVVLEPITVTHPTSEKNTKRFCRTFSIEGLRDHVVQADFVATDSTQTTYVCNKYLCSMRGDKPWRKLIATTSIKSADLALKPFYCVDREVTGSRRVVENEFKLQSETWKLVHKVVHEIKD